MTSQVPAVGTQLAQGDFSGALQSVFLAMANNGEVRNGVARATPRTPMGRTQGVD